MRSSAAAWRRRISGRTPALEGRDGEKWRKVMGYIATAIVGVVLGYLFKQIGM